MSLLLALVLGFVSGLRAFTPLAALALTRGGPWGFVFGAVALLEYVVDAAPQTPSRLTFPSIVLRPLLGAVAGWIIVSRHTGSPAAGALAGVIGALAGTYGGHAARSWAIVKIGAIPAAVTEDVVAAALGAAVVLR